MQYDTKRDLDKLVGIALFIVVFATIVTFGTKTTNNPAPEFKDVKLTERKPAIPSTQVTSKIVSEKEYFSGENSAERYANLLEGRHGSFLEYCLDQISNDKKTPEFWQKTVAKNPEIIKYAPRGFAKRISVTH